MAGSALCDVLYYILCIRYCILMKTSTKRYPEETRLSLYLNVQYIQKSNIFKIYQAYWQEWLVGWCLILFQGSSYLTKYIPQFFTNSWPEEIQLYNDYRFHSTVMLAQLKRPRLLYIIWTKWISRVSAQPELDHDGKHFDSLWHLVPTLQKSQMMTLTKQMASNSRMLWNSHFS